MVVITSSMMATKDTPLKLLAAETENTLRTFALLADALSLVCGGVFRHRKTSPLETEIRHFLPITLASSKA